MSVFATVNLLHLSNKAIKTLPTTSEYRAVNEAVTKKALVKYTRTEDPEIINRLYQFYGLKVIDKAPYITPAAIKSAIDEVAVTIPQIRNTPPTTFYDERFVKDLETSGYLQKLYP